MTTTKRIAAATLTAIMAAAPLATFAEDNGGTQGDNNGQENSVHIMNSGLRGKIQGLFGGNHKDGENKDNESAKGAEHEHGMSTTTTAVKADGSITARIAALTDLKARINSNTNLSASDKTDLIAGIDAQIAFLTSLKARIDNGTETKDQVKIDFNNALHSWKGMSLAMPKAAVTAASDRILGIANSMDTLGAKLDARIAAAQTAGKDVTAAQAARADFTAKVALARTDANAAAALAAQVTLNATDPAQIAANHQKLVDARAKIDAASKALKAARADVKTIAKSLDIKIDTSAELK